MSGLLDGMRVLDAGIWRPVPHATQMLADLGADVCKLEPPGGDPMRVFPDLFRDLASHKHSVIVNLRTDEGRASARELAAKAHVFCEGWRPGVAARLGLSYDDVRAVNPSIVYCSISGYGQTGPLVTRPGHDVNYQALAGALAPRLGDNPTPEIPRVPVADLAAGAVASMLICAAWARQQQTGEGEYIDVAMADVVAAWMGPHEGVAVAGRSEAPGGSAGYGVFETRDGEYLTLAVIAEDHFWQAVCDALELPHLRALTHAQRLDQVRECNAAVADAIFELPTVDALTRLEQAGAPVAPILTGREMARHPQFRERRVVIDTPDGLRLGFPARLLHHPAEPPGPVPEQGADPPDWT